MTRLYLITPQLTLAGAEPFAKHFAAACKAGRAASALVRLAPGAAADAKRILAPLLPVAAAEDVALMIENDVRLAPRIGADGVHVAGAGAELEAAIESLHPDRIVGAGTLRLRDEAMTAGEAGADYVMFGEPRLDGYIPPLDEALERVGWWAEIFETPCVGFAASLEAAAALAAAGADFVALEAAIWSAPSPEEAARHAARLLSAASGGKK
jgi:thiamine-phosphate pyrophosphorylase